MMVRNVSARHCEIWGEKELHQDEAAFMTYSKL